MRLKRASMRTDWDECGARWKRGSVWTWEKRLSVMTRDVLTEGGGRNGLPCFSIAGRLGAEEDDMAVDTQASWAVG